MMTRFRFALPLVALLLWTFLAGAAPRPTRRAAVRQAASPVVLAATPIPADSAVLPVPVPAVSIAPAKPRKSAPRPVRVLRVRSVTDNDSTRLRLDDHVVLDVAQLRQALRRDHRQTSDLRLYFDDILVPIAPEAVDTLRDSMVASLRFHLLRNDTTERVWRMFYRIPGKYEHLARVSVGYSGGQIAQAYPAPRRPALQLELIRPLLMWVGVSLVALLLLALLRLSSDSNLVRNDNSAQLPPPPHTPTFSRLYRKVSFSLTKSHVALWTFLVVSAYLMIYLVTGELPNIPNSLLGLLGISLANGVFGNVINRNQDAQVAVRHQDFRSQGFFRDIVSDENGVSVARLQFVVFNVVVMLYFVRHVLKNWGLPDFDSSLLALISISSAGFLVQKTNENNSPGQQAQNTAAALGLGGAPAPTYPQFATPDPTLTSSLATAAPAPAFSDPSLTSQPIGSAPVVGSPTASSGIPPGVPLTTDSSQLGSVAVGGTSGDGSQPPGSGS